MADKVAGKALAQVMSKLKRWRGKLEKTRSGQAERCKQLQNCTAGMSITLGLRPRAQARS